MRILCLVIPHFAANVERQDEPGLKGQPLIIIQEGRAMDCSAEALDQGVRLGMKREGAEKLYPEALIRAADITRYEEAFERVLGVLAGVSPVVEAGGWGEAYVDISGQISRFGDEGILCQEVRRKLQREVGLTGMMGVAGNQFTSYVAACITGWGKALLLHPGMEGKFLAPLPVDLLPIHEEMREELRLLGIHTMGQFAQLPGEAVVARFGSQGRRAHQLAQGRDGRPLIPYQRPPVVEANLDFEPPLERDETLAWGVRELAHTCCQRLHHQGLSCQEVHLSLSFEDGSSHDAQRTLSGPTANPAVVEASAQELLAQLTCTERVTEGHLVLGRLRAEEGKQLGLGVVSRSTEVDLGRLVRPLVARFGTGPFCEGRVLDFSSPMAELRFTWQSWAKE